MSATIGSSQPSLPVSHNKTLVARLERDLEQFMKTAQNPFARDEANQKLVDNYGIDLKAVKDVTNSGKVREAALEQLGLIREKSPRTYQKLTRIQSRSGQPSVMQLAYQIAEATKENPGQAQAAIGALFIRFGIDLFNGQTVIKRRLVKGPILALDSNPDKVFNVLEQHLEQLKKGDPKRWKQITEDNIKGQFAKLAEGAPLDRAWTAIVKAFISVIDRLLKFVQLAPSSITKAAIKKELAALNPILESINFLWTNFHHDEGFDKLYPDAKDYTAAPFLDLLKRLDKTPSHKELGLIKESFDHAKMMLSRFLLNKVISLGQSFMKVLPKQDAEAIRLVIMKEKDILAKAKGTPEHAKVLAKVLRNLSEVLKHVARVIDPTKTAQLFS